MNVWTHISHFTWDVPPRALWLTKEQWRQWHLLELSFVPVEGRAQDLKQREKEQVVQWYIPVTPRHFFRGWGQGTMTISLDLCSKCCVCILAMTLHSKMQNLSWKRQHFWSNYKTIWDTQRLEDLRQLKGFWEWFTSASS